MSLFFFDIDGTLRNFKEGRISPPTKKSLELLRARGHEVIISTGRHPLEIENENLLESLSIDGAITLNGSLCYYHGERISRTFIHPEDVETTLAYLKEHPFPVIFFEEKDMFVTRINEDLEKVQAHIHTAIPKVAPLSRVDPEKTLQMVAYSSRGEEQKLLARLKHTKGTYFHPHGLDLDPLISTKALGVRAIIKASGLTQNESYAFGDGNNDRPMFEAVGTAVAMGNALPELKEKADRVIGSVDEDGIVHYLLEEGLIFEEEL